MNYLYLVLLILELGGTALANFVLQTVTDDLGCLATDSVIEMGGDLLFLSQDGLRPVSGTDKIGDVNLETVSKNIQSIFTDIVFDDLASKCCYRQNKRLSLGIFGVQTLKVL